MWAGVPVVKSRLFVFGNFENESDKRPLSTFRANAGGETAAGNVTRVLASDLTQLSAFLKSNYDTGSFEPATDNTPQKRTMVRTDDNLSNSDKISFNSGTSISSCSASATCSTREQVGRAISVSSSLRRGTYRI